MIAVVDRPIRTTTTLHASMKCDGGCGFHSVTLVVIGERDMTLCRACLMDLERRLFEYLWDSA